MSKYVTGLLLIAALLLAACTGVAPAPAGTATEAAATEAAGEAATEAAAAPASGEVVELTMGSWRVDDVEQMNAILAKFSEENPNIKIKFDPTNPP